MRDDGRHPVVDLTLNDGIPADADVPPRVWPTYGGIVRGSGPDRTTPTVKKDAKAIAARIPKTTVASAVKKSTPWFMSEKCPHGWVNSATCEKNDGGCVR